MSKEKVKTTGAPSSATIKSELKHYAEEEGVERNGVSQAVYKDVMGFVASEPVDKRTEMYEQGDWDEKFEEIDEQVAKGERLEDAVSKAVDTTSYAIPIYISDEVLDVDEAKHPVAETLARVAIDSDEIEIDVVEQRGQADSFSEGGDVPKADDTRARYTYQVVTYGRKNEITDHIQLSRSSLNPVDTEIEQQGKAVRGYEERQILQGTNNDVDGFEGLQDFVGAGKTFDGTGSTLGKNQVRELITEVEVANGNLDDIIVATDTRSYSNLKESVQDFLRFESPNEELNFGFRVLDVQGVPVLKTSGLPNASGSREAFAFDASAHYMAMLRDVTTEPQPRGVGASDLADSVHTHAIGSLVSHAKDRIAKYENLD